MVSNSANKFVDHASKYVSKLWWLDEEVEDSDEEEDDDGEGLLLGSEYDLKNVRWLLPMADLASKSLDLCHVGCWRTDGERLRDLIGCWCWGWVLKVLHLSNTSPISSYNIKQNKFILMPIWNESWL